MKAQLLLDERVPLGEEAFAELRGVRVSASVSGSAHDLKYSLALVVNGICVLRYDNETGKGDHKHVGEIEMPYRFTAPAALLADFWRDVDQWKESR
jgi:hypothetical protein